MNFNIESTYDGRGLYEEDGIVGASTLVSGQLVALTAGAGKPTCTLVTTALPDALITSGGVTGAACKYIRVLPGDILRATAMAADGTTALSAGEITSLIALVGTQVMRVSATGATLDGVNASGGKMSLISFDSDKKIVRVRAKA